MLNLGLFLVGPLAAPECRRAVARGWVIVVRSLAATAVLGMALMVVWWWWAVSQTEADHSPYSELRLGLAIVEGMLVTVALVMGPAVMAGSLAGEKERGVLSLLLTTRVSSREVITGRLVGKLSQVSMVLLAGAPAVVLLAALAGMSPGMILVLLLVPGAVAWGGGGLSALASTVSRRGRDALLAVYLIDLLFLLTPLVTLLSLPLDAFAWLSALNPYIGLRSLVWEEETTIAGVSIGLWLLMGLTGAALASWRLRPACLAAMGGSERPRQGMRGAWVPPVDERRPMLWKELFVERVGSLGWVGTWVGRLLVFGLLAVSTTLTVVIAWHSWHVGDPGRSDWARSLLSGWLSGTGVFLSMLIQWAIGLRAAVSISSERERSTWDALLTSPLEPREIVRAKLMGSVNALRWLIFAAFLSWTLGVMVDALPLADAVRWGAETLVVGTFMAAVGVRVSLESSTATRAMSATIGLWLGAYVAVTCAAALAIASVAMIVALVWLGLSQFAQIPPLGTVAFPVSMAFVWPATNDLIYLSATALIVADSRVRFDRLAGRMTGGRMAVTLDAMLYGHPEAPVPVAAKPEKWASNDELPDLLARPGGE